MKLSANQKGFLILGILALIPLIFVITAIFDSIRQEKQFRELAAKGWKPAPRQIREEHGPNETPEEMQARLTREIQKTREAEAARDLLYRPEIDPALSGPGE